MRRLATAERIRTFFEQLGRVAHAPATVYLSGGATAVLIGWRDSTVAIDVKFVPDSTELLRAAPTLKDELAINVELASPDLFLPVAPGWEDRSPWEAGQGSLTVRHFDLTAQALSKLERGHTRDLADVQAMLDRGLITAAGIRSNLAAIEPELFRFPAFDPPSLRQAIEEFLGPQE